MTPDDPCDGPPRKNSLPIAKLGSTQFFVLSIGVATIVTVTGLLLHHSTYEEYIKAVGIKPFEARFGFRTGPLSVQGSGELQTTWGIVSVDEDGEFARAGLRSGDIPFGPHSGVIELYGALHQASAGESTSFEVFNAVDTDHGADGLREIRLPAMNGRLRDENQNRRGHGDPKQQLAITCTPAPEPKWRLSWRHDVVAGFDCVWTEFGV